MRARAILAASATVVALAGCRDVGLPDRNLPLEEATHRAPDPLVQAVHPGTRPADEAAMPADEAHGGAMAVRLISLGDQTFMPQGTPARMDAATLTQVGGSGAMTLYAARGTSAPYDRVYMAHPGGLYVTYMPVHDTSGDVAARLHAQQSGSGGGH